MQYVLLRNCRRDFSERLFMINILQICVFIVETYPKRLLSRTNLRQKHEPCRELFVSLANQVWPAKSVTSTARCKAASRKIFTRIWDFRRDWMENFVTTCGRDSREPRYFVEYSTDLHSVQNQDFDYTGFPSRCPFSVRWRPGKAALAPAECLSCSGFFFRANQFIMAKNHKFSGFSPKYVIRR